MMFKMVLSKLLSKLLPKNFSNKVVTAPVRNPATFFIKPSNGLMMPEINSAGKAIGNATKPIGSKLIKIPSGIRIKPGRPSDKEHR